jgi:GAF domain-containing protein
MTTVASSPAPLTALTAERLRVLIEVSQQVNSTLDIDELFPRILDLTMRVVEGEAGSLWIADGDVLRCVAAAGPVAAGIEGRELERGAGVIGWVIENRERVLATQAEEDERFTWQTAGVDGFKPRSVLTVPLVARDECVGALQIINDIGGKDEFEAEDVAFVLALADDAASAVRNARLLEAERRAHDLKALLEVSHEITSTFELDRVLASLVNLAGRAVPFERCVLALWSGDSLHVRAISGEETIDRKAAAVRGLESFLLWASELGTVLDIPDVEGATDEQATEIRRRFGEYLAQARVRGMLLLPLRDAEGDLGMLHFELPAPDFLEQWNREAAQLLGNEAALAIRNAQLYADVPFISWLEPLAEKRRAVLAMPRARLMRYAMAALMLLLLLTVVRLPLRVPAETAVLRTSIQRPARATVAGILDRVLVQEGERVSAGQAVALLRNDGVAERTRLAEADYNRAQGELVSAQGRRDPAAAALARIDMAELADITALLRDEQQRLSVVAPAAGVLITPRLDEKIGGWHDAGEPLLWIGDPDRIEIELTVRQEGVAAIRTGDRVRVRTSAHPAVRFEGRVSSVALMPATAEAVPLYTVRALLDNSAGLLRHGMVARARVYTTPRPIGELILRRPWRWIRMHIWW